MARTATSPAVKAANSRLHAVQAAKAAARIIVAIDSDSPPNLRDAKVLEAAGCYIRRNAAE